MVLLDVTISRQPSGGRLCLKDWRHQLLCTSSITSRSPGRLQPLTTRWPNTTIGFFKTHSIGYNGVLDGQTMSEIGTRSNQLTYILAFDSMRFGNKNVALFQMIQVAPGARREEASGRLWRK